MAAAIPQATASTPSQAARARTRGSAIISSDASVMPPRHVTAGSVRRHADESTRSLDPGLRDRDWRPRPLHYRFSRFLVSVVPRSERWARVHDRPGAPALDDLLRGNVHARLGPGVSR